jgi:hypothetical protein
MTRDDLSLLLGGVRDAGRIGSGRHYFPDLDVHATVVVQSSFLFHGQRVVPQATVRASPIRGPVVLDVTRPAMSEPAAV